MFPDKQNAQSYSQMPVPSKRSHSYFTAFVITLVLLIGVSALAGWLFFDTSGLRTDFDGEVESAAAAREEVIRAEVQAEFDEAEKSPLKTNTVAEAYGGITFTYPKTWSVHSIERESGSTPLNLYAHPNIVPDTSGETAFAFRMQISESSYDSEIKSLDKRVNTGATTARPYKSNGVLGLRFDGELDSKTSGTMVVLPLRDKTLLLWTESSKYKTDFLKVAESLKFQP